MKRKVKALLQYIIKDSHPDAELIDNIFEIKEYSDTFIIGPDQFTNTESMRQYIERELALVASGGYSTEHIQIVDFITIVENIYPEGD